MGEISELHSQALKQKRQKVQEIEFDLRFCEEMIHKERLQSKQLKTQLSNSSNKYEQLYRQAKSYILSHHKEKEKITELMAMLDKEHRQEITSQLDEINKNS